MQKVGQNEKKKQKLHKLTPDEFRPDRWRSPRKIPFLRVGSLVGWLWCCVGSVKHRQVD
jgi:hypothetical protein